MAAKYKNTSSCQGRLVQHIGIYEEGIRVVPHEKRSDLWSLYLKYLLELVACKEAEQGFPQMDELRLVNEKFEQAHKDGYLTEDFYIFWVELDQKLHSRSVLLDLNRSSCFTRSNTHFEIYQKGML